MSGSLSPAARACSRTRPRSLSRARCLLRRGTPVVLPAWPACAVVIASTSAPMEFRRRPRRLLCRCAARLAPWAPSVLLVLCPLPLARGALHAARRASASATRRPSPSPAVTSSDPTRPFAGALSITHENNHTDCLPSERTPVACARARARARRGRRGGRCERRAARGRSVRGHDGGRARARAQAQLRARVRARAPQSRARAPLVSTRPRPTLPSLSLSRRQPPG